MSQSSSPVAATKTCTKCGRALPREMFNRARRGRDGLNAQCKDCGHAYYIDHREHILACCQKWVEKNREKSRAIKQTWREANPQKQREAQDAYVRKNPEKVRAANDAWAKANREAYLAIKRAAQHRRKARQLAAPGDHNGADVAAQYLRQGGRCYWCGDKVGKDYHVDHVIPLSRGGSNGPENLVISCAPCNLSKHDKLPHEWSDRLF